MIGTMRLIMDDKSLQTIEQVQRFLEGSGGVEFRPLSREEKYEWVESVLMRFKYPKLGRTEKGTIRRFIQKITGYSRAQVVRMISQYNRDGQLRLKEYQRHRFQRKYTWKDMELLARTDELHGFLSGPATKRILEREYEVYGLEAFQNISGISVAHLYNLRKKNVRLGVGKAFTKTRSVSSRIGERVKPDPQGEPGHIRIDTVHQGDWEGEKGVYHVNAVDEVTQWEIVVSVERISEACLVPALELILDGFPFRIKGFHSDNGSEFVNHPVARLLNKMLVRFTKSRPRHTNDNGLVESKNGSVIRKHLGYAHIPQRYASRFNAYYAQYFNPYINFHRPCFFPVTIVDPKGKVRKEYPYEEVMTPYERLKSLPGAKDLLASGMTWVKLDAIAHQMSDNEFAERMVKARSDLFEQIPGFGGGLPEAGLVSYPHIHTVHKERKRSKKKETIIMTPSGSFLD